MVPVDPRGGRSGVIDVRLGLFAVALVCLVFGPVVCADPPPVEEQALVKDEGEDKKGGAKKGDAKKGDDDEAKKDDAAPAGDGKPAWRAGSKAGLEVKGISCIRLHPNRRGVMWAYVHGMGPAQSKDDGKTWTVKVNGIPDKDLPGLESQVRITLDPEDARVMYLVIDGQIYRTSDTGETWGSITSGALASLSWDKLKSTHLSWEVQLDPRKSNRLLVGTHNDGDHNGGFYESTNAGKSWEEIAGSAKAGTLLGNDTYMVRSFPGTDRYVTVGGRRGIYFSDNRGRKFKRNDPGGTGLHDTRWISEFIQGDKSVYVADARGIWRSKDSGKKWAEKSLLEGDAVYVCVDRHNKRRVLAVMHDRGILLSDDARHLKWRPIGGKLGATIKEDYDPEAGYRRAEIREIYVHPRDKKVMYLGSPVTGLHVSSDLGKTMTLVEAPQDADPKHVIPATIARLALVGVHPKRDGGHIAISDIGVVYSSQDRCETWKRTGRIGMTPRALFPDDEKDCWYVGGRHVMRTSDGGATWEVVHTPKDPEEQIVAIHRGKADGSKPGALRILHERSGTVATFDLASQGWKDSKAPKFSSAETWASSLAVDSVRPDHMVVAARTTRQAWSPRDENGGVFETWDGGNTWTDLTDTLKISVKDSTEEKKGKEYWNRGRFVAIDFVSGMIIYGSNRRGIYIRPFLDPKSGKKLEIAPRWVDITPSDPAEPRISAYVHALTGDETDTRLVVQLRGARNETSMYEIGGRMLKAVYDYEVAPPANKPKEKPAGWTEMTGPGGTVHLSSLFADGQLPGRLLGCTREGGHGVHIFEVPGSKPGEAAPPKDDDEKEVAAPTIKPPEGMRCFTGGVDKVIRIWGVDSGEPKQDVDGHTNEITCLGLTPDESYLVSAALDRTVRLWSASHGKPVATIQAKGAVKGLAFDDDSEFAYVAIAETQKLMQIKLAGKDSKVVKEFSGHSGAVISVACSEDTNRVYSGGEDNVIIVWDTKKGTEVNSIVAGSPVIALAVASDGSRIYAAGRNSAISAFDATGKAVGSIENLSAHANDLAISPDGQTLYATTTDGILAIDTKEFKVRMTHAAPDAGEMTCVSTSADGKWILAGDVEGGLWLWAHTHAKAFRARIKAHEGAIFAVAVTPDETEEAEEAPPGDGKPGDSKPGDGAQKQPGKGGDAPPK